MRDKPRRHPNRAEKRALKVAELARHLKATGRKAQKNIEPNDRRDDPEYARKLKRISAIEVDKLMRDDEE
jgi:hypothetical protein